MGLGRFLLLRIGHSYLFSNHWDPLIQIVEFVIRSGKIASLILPPTKIDNIFLALGSMNEIISALQSKKIWDIVAINTLINDSSSMIRLAQASFPGTFKTSKYYSIFHIPE